MYKNGTVSIYLPYDQNKTEHAITIKLMECFKYASRWYIQQHSLAAAAATTFADFVFFRYFCGYLFIHVSIYVWQNKSTNKKLYFMKFWAKDPHTSFLGVTK